MSLRDALQSIYDQRGKLTPALVVDEARDPGHPLHSRFEWDDEIAGENWRRTQAAELIRSVKIRRARPSGGDPLEVRAWHAVRGEEATSAYEPTEDIARDPVASQILLGQMRRDWEQFKLRYEQFDEFRQLVLGDLNGEAA